jgi:hypothetical protein
VIEDSFRTLADAIILHTIQSQYFEYIPESTNNIKDALSFLYVSFENLTSPENFIWSAARDEFVENFTKLAMKSQMQVGHHTSKTFAEIHSFLNAFVEKDKTLQHKLFTQEPKQ